MAERARRSSCRSRCCSRSGPGVGYYAVIFLAGLQNIPEELYDAARIDGCNDFQKHWHVSLPGLRPQIVFVAVISSLAALKVFDEIYVLTNRTGGHPRQRA